MNLRSLLSTYLSLVVGLCSLVATRDAFAQLPVGFAIADADGNGSISLMELTDYLSERLTELEVPFDRVFAGIDTDGNKALSEAEFDKRHKVLEDVLGPDWMGQQALGFAMPPDPGAGYVLFPGLNRPMDDLKIYSAIHHRYLEQLAQPESTWTSASWKRIDLDRVPKSASVTLPKAVGQKPTTEALFRATAVMIGGGSPDQMSIGGAVIISPDGLAVTNFHIANLFNERIVGLLSDGRVVRVTKFLAGDLLTDVALVQLELAEPAQPIEPAQARPGQLDQRELPWVPVAQATPDMSDSIVMVHHTENRFFTYDRGYIKRYAMIGTNPWMEISADFAPGGSGCGIFNAKHELVGLVSMIMMGDGPTIASQDLSTPPEDESAEGSEEFGTPGAIVVVKLAVPVSAIRALCK